MNNNHFTILMNGYNSAPWIRTSVLSALGQDYDNFDVICVDACTNDGTMDVLEEYRFNPKVSILRNATRKFQLENISLGVSWAEEKSIIVTLDFDDWLPHNKVLQQLNNIYTKDVWMTYGTYEEHPKASVSHIYRAYPDEVIKSNSFRNHRWLASHLRTFRKELFAKIKDEDKKFNGEYLKYAGDLAFMLPMLEMAGEKSRYISDIMYVYNRTNPLSEDKVAIAESDRNAKFIKAKTPYERLSSLY